MGHDLIWQVVAASTQGRSHRRAALPCQDAHGYRILGDLVIGAVADGLGSSPKSGEGAKRSVDTALHTLGKAFEGALPSKAESWIDAFRDAFAQARRSLEESAQISGLPVRDYGTTLIAIAVNQEWLAVGHIGDGAAVALLADDTMDTISAPQRGEYANEVTPLTAPEAMGMARFSARQTPIKAAALVTDGLQDLCINAATGRPYTQFFAPFFDAIVHPMDSAEASRRLGDFLDSDRVSSKTDDDKTLVLFGRVLQGRGDLSGKHEGS